MCFVPKKRWRFQFFFFSLLKLFKIVSTNWTNRFHWCKPNFSLLYMFIVQFFFLRSPPSQLPNAPRKRLYNERHCPLSKRKRTTTTTNEKIFLAQNVQKSLAGSLSRPKAAWSSRTATLAGEDSRPGNANMASVSLLGSVEELTAVRLNDGKSGRSSKKWKRCAHTTWHPNQPNCDPAQARWVAGAMLLLIWPAGWLSVVRLAPFFFAQHRWLVPWTLLRRLVVEVKFLQKKKKSVSFRFSGYVPFSDFRASLSACKIRFWFFSSSTLVSNSCTRSFWRARNSGWKGVSALELVEVLVGRN